MPSMRLALSLSALVALASCGPAAVLETDAVTYPLQSRVPLTLKTGASGVAHNLCGCGLERREPQSGTWASVYVGTPVSSGGVVLACDAALHHLGPWGTVSRVQELAGVGPGLYRFVTTVEEQGNSVELRSNTFELQAQP